MKTLCLEDAAKFLHVSAYSLRQMAEAGKVPGAKTGPKGYRWVFTDEALEQFMREEIERQTKHRRFAHGPNTPEPECSAPLGRRRKAVAPPPLP